MSNSWPCVNVLNKFQRGQRSIRITTSEITTGNTQSHLQTCSELVRNCYRNRLSQYTGLPHVPRSCYSLSERCPASSCRTTKQAYATQSHAHQSAHVRGGQDCPISICSDHCGSRYSRSKTSIQYWPASVNFPGTDYLKELARCRTVKLANNFRGEYVTNKAEQVKEEIIASLNWWSKHADTSHNVSLVVPLTVYGVANYEVYGWGYEQSLGLKGFEDWLPSLSPAARKTVSFSLSLGIG